MKQNLFALLCGVIFGVGLSLSHMVNPDKVLNFLDVLGTWDPSLALVMLGALPVARIAFNYGLKRPTPVLASEFHLAKKSAVDKKLLIGASIFGVGWGMAGYCPGPVITGLGLFSLESVIMLAAIIAGFIFYNQFVE